MKKTIHLLLTLLLVSLTTFAVGQTTYYVQTAANGGDDANDGQSWNTAFATVQQALQAAGTPTAGDQIWVAAGTYYPDEGAGQTDNDRDASFVMKNNLAIYGGFAGNEPADFDLNQRSITANTTILSGDIDQNDQTDGDNSLNSNHVIFNNDNGLDETAVLDGFTITAGRTAGDGAGIHNINASPTFRNCTISKNIANNGGGNYSRNSSPLWVNCVFVGNEATNDGGGMYNIASSQPRLTNCTMEGNQNVLNRGGSAIANDGNSRSILNNCILWHNVRTSTHLSIFTITGNYTATRSLIQEQDFSDDGGLNGQDYANDPLFVQQTNFTDPSVVPDLRLQICSPLRNIGNNEADIDGSTGSQTIADIATDITGNLRIFNSTIDLGAYEMQATPNTTTYTGDIIYVNAAVVGGTQNGTSWANAYSNLQDALTQTCLSAATQIWVAKGTYYPDEGGGKPNNDRQATFIMQNGLKIIGGFVGNEAPDYDLNSRDLETNKTVLSGNIDQNVEEYTGLQFSGIDNNSFHLFYHYKTKLDNTAVLNGFTLIAANANEFNNGQSRLIHGAGMHNTNSSPSIKNCIFSNNTTDSAGAGLYLDESNTTIENCDFLNNRAERGVGIYSEFTNLNVNNCTFVNNIGANRFGANGGGIYQRRGTLNCTNSLFTGNRVVLDELTVFDLQDNDPENRPITATKNLGGSSIGGAIYSVVSESTRLINCTIEGNEAVEGGGGIYFTQNLFLTNTTVWNNKGESEIGSAEANVFNFSSAEFTADHSLVQGYNPTGEGNFDGTDSSIDPLFVSESEYVSGTTTISLGDLRLQRCSPLLNQGTNTGNKQAVDLVGNPRIFDATNNGIIDLGVYELQNKPFSSLAASTTPATCQAGTSNANSDGKITLTGFTNSDKYQYSAGNTFNAGTATPDSPTAIPVNGVIADNLANANQSYTVRITNGNGCTIDRIVILTATSCDCTTPALANIANQTICQGDNFSTVSTSVTNGVSVTYQWYNSNGSSNPNTSAIGGQTSATLTALPTAVGNYQYRVEATRTDDATCTANETVSLVINELPTATLTSSAGNTTVCTGNPITFTAGGGVTYEFFVNNNSVQSGASNTYQTSTLANGDKIKVTVENANGCTDTSTELTAQIGDTEQPVPTIANLPMVTAQCFVSVTAPTATDNCAGTVTATATDPTTFNENGMYTINWQYDDGNGNTVTQLQQVTVEDCNENAALHFDGQNDNIEINNFTLPASFTIETWINYDGQQDNTEAIFTYESNFFFFGLDQGHPRLFGTPVQAAQPLATNVWTHIAVSFDAITKQVHLYIDGQLDRSRLEENYGSFATTSTAKIGLGEGLAGISGALDDFRVWNYARSAAEISEQANCQLSGQETGLELYLNFDAGQPNADNRNLSTVVDQSINDYNSVLNRFALLGSQSNFVAGTAQINDFCAGSLAVEWLDFSAQVTDKEQVILNWSVANENETTHYEVERSADGKTFENIGKVAANGDWSYQFLDRNPLHGDNFYRIKEVENSGRFSFSETQLVQLTSTASTLLVYPNPTADVVQLQLPLAETENAVFTLIDIHGKIILQQNWSSELDLSTLPNGVYLLRVKTANGDYQQRIVKQE